MKLNAFVFIIACATLFGCARDKVTVQVVRHPLLKFNLNANASWTADNVAFGPISKVVVYPHDTINRAVVYNRLTLNSAGKATSGENLQFIISFDVIDAAELKGKYTPLYSITRGLAEVKIYDITNSNNLSAYSLCSANIIKPQFQIDRQNSDERLISGIFQMTLCNERDSTQKVNVVNGTFTDIRY